jgi:hypothetical protein
VLLTKGSPQPVRSASQRPHRRAVQRARRDPHARRYGREQPAPDGGACLRRSLAPRVRLWRVRLRRIRLRFLRACRGSAGRPRFTNWRGCGPVRAPVGMVGARCPHADAHASNADDPHDRKEQQSVCEAPPPGMAALTPSRSPLKAASFPATPTCRRHCQSDAPDPLEDDRLPDSSAAWQGVVAGACRSLPGLAGSVSSRAPIVAFGVEHACASAAPLGVVGGNDLCAARCQP